MKRYISRKSVNGKPCALRGASTVWRGDYTNQYSETIQGGVFLPYHWTGGEKRLARVQRCGRFSKDYAFEELIAEMGSLFVATSAGIPQSETEFQNHASYIDSWLSNLRSDNMYIFKAAAEASKAAGYLLRRVGMGVEETVAGSDTEK